MTNLLRAYAVIPALTVACAMAQPQQSNAEPAHKTRQVASGVQPTEDAGARVFAAHCSRCHNPPEQLNPRVTATVVRHMRVRANLSETDERDLLRFFNP